MRGQQAQPRRLAKAIDAGVAASATGMAGSTGHVDAWAPLLRRLTPQVVVQAGRPHCHQKGPAAHQGVNAASKGAHAHSPRPAHSPTPTRAPPVSRGCRFESCRRPSPAYTSPAGPPTSAVTCTSGNTKTPEPQQVPGSGGGGWGIRTPEGLHPTRFPSVRHRPLGESSVHIVPDNHKQETPLSANPSQWSRSQMGVRAFTGRR